MKHAQQIKLLIVEDEVLTGMVLKQELINQGYIVLEIVTKGAIAIEKALSLKPDLILMDIFLANHVTGIEAARRIQEKASIPVLYLSAFIDQNTEDESKTTNAIGFIKKPYDFSEVNRAIKDYFHLS